MFLACLSKSPVWFPAENVHPGHGQTRPDLGSPSRTFVIPVHTVIQGMPGQTRLHLGMHAPACPTYPSTLGETHVRSHMNPGATCYTRASEGQPYVFSRAAWLQRR